MKNQYLSKIVTKIVVNGGNEITPQKNTALLKVNGKFDQKVVSRTCQRRESNSILKITINIHYICKC
jgi:uncharacterized GH25 family protein